MAERDFESSLRFGDEGERRIAMWLMSRGSVLTPVYQYVRDGAPVLLHRVDEREVARVLPDIMCWRGGTAFFAECKRKTRWVQWGRERETGCDLRKWHEYSAIRGLTGQRVWLFFLHEEQEPTGLFAAEVGKLARRVREWDGRVQGSGRYITQPEALFPESSLKRFADLADMAPPTTTAATPRRSAPRPTADDARDPARPNR